MIQISPEELLTKYAPRVTNFVIQYSAYIISVVGTGNYLDLKSPSKMFFNGFVSLNNAATPQEAVLHDTIGAIILCMFGLAAEDLNAYLTFGAFLLVLVKNVLTKDSQAVY